jgi:signal transduction histidine kinase/CheY-like chemotaxis protein
MEASSVWARAERRTLFVGLLVTTGAVLATRLASTAAWVKVWDNVHWTASYAAAAALAWLSSGRARGPLRKARRWFALGTSGLLAGQLLWNLQVAFGWNPFPGPSDALYVSLGPLLAAGVLSLARGQSRARRVAAMLDGAGVGLCVLAFTLAAYLPQRGDFDGFTMAVLAAYPTALLSAAALLVVVTLETRQPPSVPLLVLLSGILGQGALWMKWNQLTLANGLGDGLAVNYLFSFGMLWLGVGIASYEPMSRDVEGGLARAYYLSSRLLPLVLVVTASAAVAFSTSAQSSVRLAIASCMAGVILVAVIRQSLLLEEGERVKKAEAHSRALEERMTQSQRLESLGTLASGIAHDINNMLTAILGHAELLSRAAPLNEEAQASVDGVRLGAIRARDVVRRILTFSRHEATPAKPFDARELAEEVAALLRAALPARHAIEVEVEGRPHVLGSPAQIHQVLMNLGTNASQAIGDRPGKIVFKAQLFQHRGSVELPFAGKYVELSVTDDGAGMDETTRARVFEPFFTTKPRGQGTGLGLSVVHAIVLEHGGAIEVDSGPGQGSSVRVVLPAAVGLAVAAPEETSGVQAHPAAATGVALIVDDEAVIGGLLVRLLDRLGQPALATTSPEEVLELVRAEPERFAFVVTDMSMPTMSGEVLAQALRELHPDLPVVMSSGTDFVLAGTSFDDVLPKPYTLAALAALLTRLREDRGRTVARAGAAKAG